MEIKEINSLEEISLLEKFFDLPREVYKNDPIWIEENKTQLITQFEDYMNNPALRFCPILVVEKNYPVARVAAIFNPRALDKNGEPEGWIGFFEALENTENAVFKLLERAESALKSWGAKSVLATKVDNQLFGIQTSHFDFPQSIMTGHNPPYYQDLFKNCGYKVETKICSFYFSKENAKNYSKNGTSNFSMRSFHRSNLDPEITIFNDLQNKIFSNRAGYVQRSLEEDRKMIKGLLPLIDDDLIVIAQEENKPVGILICFPDLNQAKKEGKIDRARIVSIGVLPEYQKKGIGKEMCFYLAKNLLKKGYQRLEASLILKSNLPPQLLAYFFGAKQGRDFVLLRKTLDS